MTKGLLTSMQSGVELEQISLAPSAGLLTRFSWLDKLPLALGFGCLLGLSAPGFDLWWLAWIGLAPLLVLVQGARGKFDAFVTGLAFGLGYYLVALSFYLGLYPMRWMGAGDWLAFEAAAGVWAVEAFHQALLFGAFALFVFALPMRAGYLPFYRRPYFPYLFSLPLVWIFFHWVVGTSETFLGVPVNQLAYSQWQQLEIIQVSKWGGSQLVDFLIVLANAAFACLVNEVTGLAPRLTDRLDRLSSKGGALVDLSFFALVVTLLFFWGRHEVVRVAALTRLPPGEDARNFTPPVPLAVIQGNVSIEDEKLGAVSAQEISQRYAVLAHALGVALVVLPEGIVTSVQMGPGLVLSQLRQMCLAEKKEAVVGFLEPVGGGVANSARLITPRDEDHALYVKRRLVPFGEYIPVGPIAYLLPPQIKHLFTGASEQFVRSHRVELMNCAWGHVGASICVEVIYPRLIADEVREGASLLVNLSNLAWFHGSTLNKQVLAAAIFRAVENGRFLVLAANTGVSAVIDPSGLVVSASVPRKKGVLLNTVQFLYKQTPFTKMWWL